MAHHAWLVLAAVLGLPAPGTWAAAAAEGKASSGGAASRVRDAVPDDDSARRAGRGPQGASAKTLQAARPPEGPDSQRAPRARAAGGARGLKKGSWHTRWQPRQMDPLFVALAYVFDKTMVLCYKKSCKRHYPGGGAWPRLMQSRILVQDGDEVDKRILPGKGLKVDNHYVRGFVSHMAMVHNASQLNLSNVLILEEDIIASPFTDTKLTKESLKWFGQALRKELASRPWQALKFTADYPVKKFGEQERCPQRCACRLSEHWLRTSPVKGLRMCRTQRAGMGVESRCDFRNSAAYAVHRSAFPIFSHQLATLGPQTYAWVDCFVAAYLDFDHFLPSLAIQRTHRARYNHSVLFQRKCEQP